MKHPLIRFAEAAFGETGHVERSRDGDMYVHTFVPERSVSQIPDLAYFIGRPFKELVKGDYKGHNVTRWEIHLDGSGIIANKDPHVALPDEDLLAGTSFVRPIFSELDTRLQFGVKDAVSYEIILTPTKYTISDPTFLMEEGEIYPQAPPEMQTPEDPSEERVAEGPDDEQEEPEEQEEPDEE